MGKDRYLVVLNHFDILGNEVILSDICLTDDLGKIKDLLGDYFIFGYLFKLARKN